MEMLAELLRHNAWANRTVLDAFASRPDLVETICYDQQTLSRRLRHPFGTELAFLDIFRGPLRRPEVPADLDQLSAYDAETAAGLQSIAADLAGAEPEPSFFVPWFERDFTYSELMLQVIGHSAQHRSEHAWELARAGVNTGELGYISWIVGGRPSPGEKLLARGG